MDSLRVLPPAAGLFGLLLLVVGLAFAARGDSVVLPGFGLILGFFFLVIVGPRIGAGAFTLLFAHETSLIRGPTPRPPRPGPLGLPAAAVLIWQALNFTISLARRPYPS